MTQQLLAVTLALLPVSLFLGTLLFLDSYKLVHFRDVLLMIAAGAAAAVASFAVNALLLDVLGLDHRLLTRFAAPAVEEILKAVAIYAMIRAKRVGFVIDAAIFGFAVGTGFALLENLYYLNALTTSGLAVWLVRGFGTAVMHGATTAVFAMVTKVFADRRESEAVSIALPGLAIAFAMHSLFNQFVLPPVASAVLVIAIFPPLLVLVFSQSERFVQSWLGHGFDLDAELIETIESGEFETSRAGRYLQSLREHFAGPTLADMLCYIRLHAELSLRAKGVMMMREKGFRVEEDPEVRPKLAELRFLRTSIGKTGLLALTPILQASPRDLWQLRMLENSKV